MIPAAEAIGEALEDLRIGPHPGRRCLGAPAQQQAPLEIGHSAFLLDPLRDRQDDVSEFRGIGQEQVGDHQQIESFEPLHHHIRVGSRHHEIAAHHQQAAHPVRGADAVHELAGREACRRKLIRRDAPDRRDCRAVRRIIDLAIAGQLISFLPVLAPALAIALAGQARVAAIALSRLAQRQDQIDVGVNIIDAVTLLFRPAPGDHHGGCGVGQDMYGLFQQRDRNAGEAFDAIRPVARDDALHALEPGSYAT
jgi:hypothetical protein